MNKDTTPSRFVWLPGNPPSAGPIDWLVFRCRFDWAGNSAPAALHLFASTRYRLWINGEIVGYGPGRFVPPHEEFDSYDLGSYLCAGSNCIMVEVCFINANNFQSMPGDCGRFIAWGQVDTPTGTLDLTTPGDWQVQRVAAWKNEVPHFSFAIGPVELLDLAARQRVIAADPLWQAPVAISRKSDLVERSLVMPTGHIIHPAQIQGGVLIADEQCIGFISMDVLPEPSPGQPSVPRRFSYATFLHSPGAQEVTLGLHWGPHFLNGREISGIDDAARGNRQNATVWLNQGWNLLCGQPQQIQPAYPLLVGLPLVSRLIAKASPNLSDPHVLRYKPSRPMENGLAWQAAPPTLANLNLDDPAWRLVSAAELPTCPARMMSWDQPQPMAPLGSSPWPLTLPMDNDFTVMADFGTEYLGHVIVDIEAPAGTVVDLAYDERRRADGSLDLFACNPFVESADRFVCGGGRGKLETFHPRGGRYVQITIRRRSPQSSRIVLHGLALRDARCLPTSIGAFHCDSDVLNWTWDIGAQTLRAGTEEVFCDSPWRERGLYLGDSYVQSMVHMVLCQNHAVVRRALRLFAQAQHANGQMPGAAPAWLQTTWGDFTLIYTLWLHDYWARTGDNSTLLACLPAVDRLLGSPTWKTSSHSALWDVRDHYLPFIDWGVLEEARKYDENGVLNALRYQALGDAAELHRAVGHEAQARDYRQQAGLLGQAFRDRLWLPDAGRFAGGFAEGRRVEREILHVNILALAFGLADPTQEPALIGYVLQRLQTNAEKAARGQPADDFAELYFLKYALLALVRIARFDVAERLIADHMRLMQDHHAWTLWECLHRGIRQKGSLCHAWSSAPLEYFTRYVLGVREKTPGQSRHLVVNPRVAAIRQARGVVPHPAGPIQVQWHRREDGQCEIIAQGPPEVTLEIVPAGNPESRAGGLPVAG